MWFRNKTTFFFALMFGFSDTRKYNINVNKINQDIIYY